MLTGLAFSLLLFAVALVVGKAAPAQRLSWRAGRLQLPQAWPVGLIVLSFLGMWNVLAAGIVLLAGLSWWTARTKRRAQILVEQQLHQFFTLATSELHAGSAPNSALKTAYTHGFAHPDLPAELQKTMQAAVSVNGGPSLLLASDNPELQYVGGCWEAARSSGISLADLLQHADERIVSRMTQRSALAAASQGANMSALVLTALPVAGLAIGAALGARPTHILFHTTFGGMLLVAGVMLLAVGSWWSRNLIEKAGRS